MPAKSIAIMSTAIPLLSSRHVAVIGAGAAGLVAARELRREGHRVVVFERGDQVGGSWVYTAEVESEPLGLDPKRRLVHSSLYDSLRTNLPREVMGFRDYPFGRKEGKGRDSRRFPGHREVLMYLKDFAADFQIDELVRLETEVVFAGLGDGGKWTVRSRSSNCDCVDEIYDALVICNGHYVQPRLAHIPGINAWPGKQMHSHNYRTPEPFQDQVVVIIGSAASAVDISRDIATVAKEVHIAARSVEEDKLGKMPGHDNMWLHSMIDSVHEDGSVVFKDGNAVGADFIVHCTGYKYDFPFLETNGAVTVDDNRVGPLYKHVFPPALAPWLSFVGLPWKVVPTSHQVVPFPMFEMQSKWIAGILSNRIALPSKEEMVEDIEAFYSSLEASGTPKSYTHNMGHFQWDYNNWIADQCGIPAIEEWIVQMYMATSKNRLLRSESYRDEWEDDDLVLQAQRDFDNYLI
ncbi:flavin-containing monooxygenase FMO GS-OX-like 4 isoform X3 [Gastrolobium bilobum]|uniref:flavin-containing monooxygenase FMO GS-OX-like 4 isoform X3 n=1 Tax=Gastrolobium bilobum TaxID=150636 RepID=UPI002AB01B67|nr:flavin-containing monooxygenase FMO GS-OX-like 4 isoform X3 [Gastrolobium bilobum]